MILVANWANCADLTVLIVGVEDRRVGRGVFRIQLSLRELGLKALSEGADAFVL
jgi:hypothetical protein